jgi:branched-chain amino acid transport system substrate-binding protein
LQKNLQMRKCSYFYPFFTIIFLLTTVSCKKETKVYFPATSIKIAALYAQTGNLAYLGLSSTAALQTAVNEINLDFASRNIPYRFDLDVYNTQINPTLAHEAMLSIARSGCKLVIGPQTSAELLAIKPIADSLGILVVSPSSTASSLSIPNDMVFRYAPGDQIVGQAVANTMIQQGKQVLIAISRNDVGSLGLETAIVNQFSNAGGQVFREGTFDGTTTDFSTILANVRNRILNLSASYSNNQIGVLTTSFDESILLFNQASSDPVLSSVNWFGGVGFFKNQNLLTNIAASQFAVNTHFFSPCFSLPTGAETQYANLLSKIYALSGYQADALTLCSYDIMYVIAKMIEHNKGLPQGSAALQQQFLNTSNGYSGVTGNIMLNENGDRASGTFDYWGVENTNGSYKWYFVGKSQ